MITPFPLHSTLRRAVARFVFAVAVVAGVSLTPALAVATSSPKPSPLNAGQIARFVADTAHDRAALGANVRVVTVCGHGGADHTTIAAALAAAAAPTTTPPPSPKHPLVVLVLPGVYAEQGLVLPDGVSLMGTEPNRCILRYASTTFDGKNSATSALVSAPWSSHVANLTIINTRREYSSVCLSLGYDTKLLIPTSGHVIRARNLVLRGRAWDELCLFGHNDIHVDNATVEDLEALDTLSATVPAGAKYRVTNSRLSGMLTCLWLTGEGVIEFENCTFESRNRKSNAIIWSGNLGTSLTARFIRCRFTQGISQKLSNVPNDVNNFRLEVEDCDYKELGFPVKHMPREGPGTRTRRADPAPGPAPAAPAGS